jgi:PhzF family phenazine biosynthesis protein
MCGRLTHPSAGSAAILYAPGVTSFKQVDVFTTSPYRGNPVAVVLGGDGLTTEQMQRIFNLDRELPFAGHPTLGTCHAWLEAGGVPRAEGVVVQECEAGLITVRRTPEGLAFAAPPLIKSGPVDESLVVHISALLGIEREEILDAEWVDNGPGWVAVLLDSAEAVLDIRPGPVDLDLGVVGPHPAGSECAVEVRAFFPKEGATAEDPVTGSLNASLASWLLRTGRVQSPYVASQGTVMGRAGRVRVNRDETGQIWVGGGTVTCIDGTVAL